MLNAQVCVSGAWEDETDYVEITFSEYYYLQWNNEANYPDDNENVALSVLRTICGCRVLSLMPSSISYVISIVLVTSWSKGDEVNLTFVLLHITSKSTTLNVFFQTV